MVIPEEHSDKSDEELVLLTLKNQEYYSCLIDRYEAKLTRYIKRLSNLHEDDVPDVLQDVFVKAYQNLNDFDRKLKFSSWIYRITHNEVISNFRKRKVRPQNVIAVDDEKVVNRFAADVDIAKDIDKDFLSKATRKFVKKLDRKYKDVLVLRYLEDKSYEEISHILRKPLSTIGTLINRAKKKLAQEMKKSKVSI